MTQVSTPDWVKSALDDAIACGRYVCKRGRYVFEVVREVCGRFDCNVEVWEGTISADAYDETYNGEPDPTKQQANLTWRDLTIERI